MIMNSTAIYGGSFNPIHFGHMDVAKAVIDEKAADELIFMPNYVSPFKLGNDYASGEDRKMMIKEATRDMDHVYVSEFELNRHRPSYTIETLEEMKRYIGGRISFVLGADSMLEIEDWERGCDILHKFALIVSFRPGINDEITKKNANRLRDKYGTEICMLNTMPRDVSSSDIVEALKSNKSISGMVPRSVEDYIRYHGLYRR